MFKLAIKMFKVIYFCLICKKYLISQANTIISFATLTVAFIGTML